MSSTSTQKLVRALMKKFPGFYAETWDSSIFVKFDPHDPKQPKRVLEYLLKHNQTSVTLEEIPPTYENLTWLFGFKEVWYSMEWSKEMIKFFKTAAKAGTVFPQVEVIKINNLRWFFTLKTLPALVKVFPNLSLVQFIGAECGALDDSKLEAEYLPELGKAKMSTAEVIDCLGDKADPFTFLI